ncbi:peroxisomal sarcosine oxidase isoform X3 [Parasteatoda tepidariorum]|uniref:peroxisomal sarcosine oxidase isoform X3 n=1 Tax=Parasteatoda tepidariorum TaxID=114398 RepID=UPI00077FAB3F|nr:peroxisomal sarcosine oxidase-like isoform X2 [Parasteatoda tepidariorum]
MSMYDHVVVGAGIVGSWTAYQLALLGKNVLLLEQFMESHSRGSSQGESRIIRCGYKEDFFAEMMPYAFEMWKKAEEDSGKNLIVNCGVLSIFQSPADHDLYNAWLSNMRTYNPDCLDLEDTKEELFGRVLSYTKKPHAVIFDKKGGVLLAHRSVLTIQELFRKKGGQFWSNCPVTSIKPEGNEVEIITRKGQIVTPSVILCSGAWTKKLLEPNLVPYLPLQASAVKVYYWKEKEFGVHSPESGFPVVIEPSGNSLFALPSIEYPGLVKVGIHGGVDCDPDKRDQASINPAYEQTLKNHVAEHFPQLENEPSIIETCMYSEQDLKQLQLWVEYCAKWQQDKNLFWTFPATVFLVLMKESD